MEMVKILYGYHYDIYPFYVDCQDVGHSGCSRSRVYIFLAHKTHTQLLVQDMEGMYRQIVKAVRSHIGTAAVDYLTADRAEILMEAQDVAYTRRKQGKKLTAPCYMCFALFWPGFVFQGHLGRKPGDKQTLPRLGEDDQKS